MEVRFEDKITQYEQLYFTYDEPIPIKEDLKIYPVTVRDYYKFYQLISCFTLDKNLTIEGIRMTELEYMFHLIKGDSSMTMRTQFINLLSMVFHIKNGMYCDNSECDFKEIVEYKDIATQIKKIDKELKKKYKDEENGEDLLQKERKQKLYDMQLCPHCGKIMRDTFELNENSENPKKSTISIQGTQITNKDYKEIKRLYCYMNLPDYDDSYINPELKEALEEAQKLKSGNAQHPTLERQIACVVASSGYKCEEVYDMSLRKFTMLLRVADAKITYLASKIGEMSGLVTFKNPIPHWIYTKDDARKSLFDNIMSVEQVESKIGDGGKIL